MTKKKDIIFKDTISLRGPNIWTYPPVIETWIDIGELEDFPSDKLPGLYERLSTWLPGLVEHRCNYGEYGGFLRRLKEGTWAGHILEHVVLELMTLAGLPDGFGRTRETTTRGVYKLVVSNFHEEVTRMSLDVGRELLLAAIEDEPYDLDEAVRLLRRKVDRKYLGPSTAAIVLAGEKRGIPHIRLLDDGNLVQLGYGAAMRRIWTAETDQTSAIAETISRDKDLTKELISSVGVPVPEGREVDSADDAWDAAEDIGVPVVVKPTDGNHGRGVFIDLTTKEEVAKAYAIAVEEGSGVLVERSIQGIEHRLLVVGGKLVAANRSDLITVTGDGKSTVQALIDSQVNIDPRRGTTELHPLSIIKIDTAARIELERQGLSGDSVPAKDREVLIQRNANHAFDCTDEVHPETAQVVALAARVVGVTGTHGMNAVAKMVAHLIYLSGRHPGLACKDGIYLDRRHVQKTNAANWEGGRRLLMNRSVQAAVIENGASVILGEGLAYDRCSVGIVTNIVSDEEDLSRWDTQPTGGEYYTTPRSIYRTQVDVVLPSGHAVLNAEDELVADFAELCDGEVIFFAVDPANPTLLAHLAAGKRGVTVADKRVVLRSGADEIRLSRLVDTPYIGKAKQAKNIANVLAGIAAGWAMGLSKEVMTTGMKTFGLELADPASLILQPATKSQPKKPAPARK